jgi:exodeoxyribonuclease V gamma subunit
MLRLREDGDDALSREDEPFATGAPPTSALLREVFLEALSRGPRYDNRETWAAIYDARAESLARTGAMPVGLFRDAERKRHLACLGAWRGHVERMEVLSRGPLQVYRFGRAAEHERVDRLERPIVLDVPLNGGTEGARNVRVEVFGRTEIVAPHLPGSFIPVARDELKAKDVLAGFLDSVVLSLLPDRQASDEYHANVLLATQGELPPRARRIFRGIDPRRARDFLTSLLADLLGGSHVYLLPCEAVFDYLRMGVPIESSVEEMKDNGSACSSRYGPVPDFARYDPLAEDEARRVVDRRFGLFLDSGGLAE